MPTYRVPVLEKFEWQPLVLAYQEAPPGSPVKGNRYLVATVGTGAWTGHDEAVATYTGSAWLFDVPVKGWATYLLSLDRFYYFDATTWIELTTKPKVHAASHKSGGTDAIKLDELAAPTDVTTLNADATKHGLLPKLGGGTTNYLRADGTWAAPGGGGDMTKAVYDTDADDIVDKAETVDDGAGNATTAAQVKEAYTKRAVYDADYKCLTFTI